MRLASLLRGEKSVAPDRWAVVMEPGPALARVRVGPFADRAEATSTFARSHRAASNPSSPRKAGTQMRFEGKVALISAAGAGIGRATADIIGREGGTVVAVDVDQGALDRLTTEIAAAGGRAVGIRADALDAASVEDTVRRALDAHGRIDILVNAVGGSTIIPRPAAQYRRADPGGVAEAPALQPHRHLPLLARRDPGDEAAEERQDRQPRVDRRARGLADEQQRLCHGQGRASSR